MTTESKRGRTAPPPAPKRSSRRRGGLRDLFAFDSDASSRLLLIGGAALVLLLAGAFIAFGYYDTVVKPRHRTVLGAAGINISYEAMRRHMAYDVRQNPSYLQSQAAFTSLPQAAYQELLDEIILVTRGPSEQNVSVSDDELDQALRTRVGVAKEASQKDFAAAFRGALDKSGLKESEYRRMVLAEQIQIKIQQKVTAELPATLPQAKVDVIQTDTKDAADQALLRVKAGEDWATVADALSTAPDKATTHGSFDFQLEGEMNQAYSGFAFSAAPGSISDVITSGAASSQTFYVVRLAERADRPLTDTQKPAEAQRRYSKWLADAEGHLVIANHWDQKAQNDALLWVLDHTPAPTAAPAQNQQPVPTVVATGVAGTPGAEQPPANPQDSGSNNPAVPNAPVAPGGGNGQ
jgi:hypothetical protein